MAVNHHIPLPGPDGPHEDLPPGDDGSAGGPSSGTADSAEEILAQIRRLVGLIALGYVSPQQANAMLRCLKIALDERRRGERAGGPSATQQGLAELCRENPRLLQVLAPFLTDDQVACVLQQAHEDPAAGDGGP